MDPVGYLLSNNKGPLRCVRTFEEVMAIITGTIYEALHFDPISTEAEYQGKLSMCANKKT